jgi:hypothetical protein
VTRSEPANGLRVLYRVGFAEEQKNYSATYAMQRFYEQVVGLPLMTRVPNCAFFKIANGYGGHTQVLALFDRSVSPGHRGTDAATSTIDHIAFELPQADFEGERKRPVKKGTGISTCVTTSISSPEIEL